MKKLYMVKIERTIMVLADSDDEAADVALEYESEEIINGDPQGIYVFEVNSGIYFKTTLRIPKEWMDSIPYGGDDDKTVQEILKI